MQSNLRLETALCGLLWVVVLVPRSLVGAVLPPLWGDYDLVRIGAGGAAAALTIWIARHRTSRVVLGRDSTERLVLALAASHASLVVVLIAKYAAGAMPATWSHDVIQYYASAGSISGLYDPASALTPPVVTPIYPPGMVVVRRVLTPILGDGPHVLRLAVVASIAATASAIGILTARWRDRTSGWLAAGLFLAIFPQIVWSGAPTKPEYIAVALSMGGVVAACGAPEGHDAGPARLAVAGALFGAALLVKFTVVAGLLGVVLFLVAKRRWSDLLAMSAVVVLLAGGTYAGLSAASDGGLWFFTVVGNAASPDLEKAFRLGLEEFGQSFFAIVVVTLSLSILPKAWRGEGSDIDVVLSLATLVAFGLTIVTTARPGSSANYFLEAVALGAALLASHLAAESGSFSRGVRSLTLRALVATYLVLHLPSQAALLARDVPKTRLPTTLLNELDIGDTEFILSDPQYVGEVLDSGVRPLVVDSFQFTMMVQLGVLDVEVLTAPMRQGKVPVALLSQDPQAYEGLGFGHRMQPRKVIELIQERYSCAGHPLGSVVVCRWSP